MSNNRRLIDDGYLEKQKIIDTGDENVKIFQDMNEKIARDLEDYNDTVRQIESLKKEIVSLRAMHVKEVHDIQDDLEITKEELTISQKSEKEWIGRALKLKFIFDQMKKIEALPEDHSEWVDPMVKQVDIPEVSRQSQ